VPWIRRSTFWEHWTVEKIEEDGVSCIWQEANKTQRETFAAAVLEEYTPTAAGAVDLLRQP
jgi:hypothetical protein